MKKYMLDMKVTGNCSLHKNYCLLKLTSDQILPEMLPGQFVQVRVDNSPTTFLRRPISINYVDRATNELWLLVQLVGDGTRRMAEYKPGDVVNIMLPLGNGFTLPADKEQKLLLIGGGVGTAPMLYLGAILKKAVTHLRSFWELVLRKMCYNWNSSNSLEQCMLQQKTAHWAKRDM